jgi:hypothetical protein
MSSAIEAAEESGNIVALLVIINCHVSNLETCEEGVSALYRIISGSPELDIGDSAQSVANTLSLCLAKHMTEPEVIEVVLGCMRVCASKFPSLQTLLCTEQIVESVIQAMCTHTDGEETLQEQGCLVVCELAKNSDQNIRLLRGLHVEKALDQAAGLITNERNKKYPALAKEALGM